MCFDEGLYCYDRILYKAKYRTRYNDIVIIISSLPYYH